MAEKQPKGRKILIASVVVGVAIAGGLIYKFLKPQTPTAVQLVPVPVTRGQLSVKILATGIVQPENRVDIKAPIAGRVETVLVAEGTRVKKGQILAWMSSTERAAVMDAASAKGPEELKSWEALYKPTPILAPINGRIIQRNVESGQTFTTQDAIFSMSDRLTVKAQVDETDIAEIHLRMKANMVLDAYPNEQISARVDQIAFDAKTINNVTTYIVDVLPEIAPTFMRSGMTANVSFEVTSKADILTVPVEAVKIKNGQAYVLLPKEGGRANGGGTEHPIQTGLNDGRRLEVVSGLSEGDMILSTEFNAEKMKATSSGGSPFSPTGPKRGR